MAGKAGLAIWTAEDWRLVETRPARSGRSSSRDEKGRLASNNRRVSAEGSSGLVSNGGRSNSRSKRGSGSSDDRGTALVAVFTVGLAGSGATAEEMAWASRWCFADMRR